MSDFSIYHVEVVSIALEGKLPTTDHQGISKGTSRAVFSEFCFNLVLILMSRDEVFNLLLCFETSKTLKL